MHYSYERKNAKFFPRLFTKRLYQHCGITMSFFYEERISFLFLQLSLSTITVLRVICTYEIECIRKEFQSHTLITSYTVFYAGRGMRREGLKERLKVTLAVSLESVGLVCQSIEEGLIILHRSVLLTFIHGSFFDSLSFATHALWH